MFEQIVHLCCESENVSRSVATAKESFLLSFCARLKLFIIWVRFSSGQREKERYFLVPQKNESTYEKDDDVEEETKAKLLCFIFFLFFIIIIKSSYDDALGALFWDSVCG